MMHRIPEICSMMKKLYGDDDYFAEEKAKTRKGRRRSRHGGISGGVLALLWAVFLILVGVNVYVFFINDKLFTENITGRDNTVRLEIHKMEQITGCVRSMR